MIVPGLKSELKAAYDARKFMTNGAALPRIDFEQPLEVEVTAVDTLGLVSFVQCRDDQVLEFGKRFERALYLQMTPGCRHQEKVIQLLECHRELAELFKQVERIRVCIKQYIGVAEQKARLAGGISDSELDRCVSVLMARTADQRRPSAT
jgi:hypothetical protein